MSLEHYLQLQNELRQTHARFAHDPQVGQEIYQIYEASDSNNPDNMFLVSVSASRRTQLEEDIFLGRKLFRLGRKIYETTDIAKARRISDRHYM